GTPAALEKGVVPTQAASNLHTTGVGWVVLPVCDFAVGESEGEMRACPHCGATCPGEAPKCLACGAALRLADKTEAEETVKSKPNRPAPARVSAPVQARVSGPQQISPRKSGQQPVAPPRRSMP